MLKVFQTAILCIICFFSVSLHGKDYVVVKKVIDGETIQVESGETIRYIGIQAPKLYKKGSGPEFYAKEAVRYNKKLVLMKKVRLEFDAKKKDQQGRLLAYVYVKDVFVNGELVRLGYAKADIKPPNVGRKDTLLSYHKEAMDEGRGLWQENKKDTEVSYVGNKRNYILHRPECPLVKKIPDKNRIIFRRRMDAIRIGYGLCRTCKP